MEFFVFAVLVAAANAHFAPLYTAKEGITGSYIVVLNDDASLDVSLDAIKNNPFFGSLGGRIDRSYGFAINGFSATLSEKALDFVRRFDFVKYVEEDKVMRAYAVSSWGLDRIDQRDLPRDQSFSPRNRGSGGNVFVLDTGINEGHVDFGGRAHADFDAFISDENDEQWGVDGNGHGTHCAGTIGGYSYGVARDISMHAIKVLNDEGIGSVSGIVSGIEHVIEETIEHGKSLPVASMSLGGEASDALDNAVSSLHSSGITVVVAAGNNDTDACSFSPAGADKAITVAATDDNDARAEFSNFGTCVDIFAPGVSITSAWYDGNTASNTISGTSMACPHVAGGAVIMLSESNSMTPDEVKSKLIAEASSDKITDVQNSPNKLLYVG